MTTPLLLAYRRAQRRGDLLDEVNAGPARIQNLTGSWEDFDRLHPAVQAGAWTQLALEAKRKTDGIACYESVVDVPIQLPPPPERKWTPRPMDPGWQLDDIPTSEYVHALTGTEVEPGRRANCPFPDHEDHSRDFSVTRNDPSGFHCYGCNRGGTIFQFAAILWGYALPLRGENFRAVRSRLLNELGMTPNGGYDQG